MNASRKLAALGGAAALAAAALAHAQATCPADAVIGAVLAPGFTCTLGDKTFGGFAISGAPATARIDFGQLGPLFAVTLTRDGAFFPQGTVVFDYTVSAAAPAHILGSTVGVDVSFPTVITVTTENGMALSPTSIVNGGSGFINFSPGVSSLAVDNVSHITSPVAELNSITNDFAQVPISIPEPSSLPLAAAGLAGFAFAALRRRREG